MLFRSSPRFMVNIQVWLDLFAHGGRLFSFILPPHFSTPQALIFSHRAYLPKAFTRTIKSQGYRYSLFATLTELIPLVILKCRKETQQANIGRRWMLSDAVDISQAVPHATLAKVTCGSALSGPRAAKSRLIFVVSEAQNTFGPVICS